MVGEKESWSSSNKNSSCSKTMDQYFYPMILSTIKTYNAKSFQIHRLMLSHNNQSFHTKQSKTKCSSFSVIRYSESIHTYFHIWITWYSNAFLIFVCFHTSSLSIILSIQIKCSWYSFQNLLLRCFH